MDNCCYDVTEACSQAFNRNATIVACRNERVKRVLLFVSSFEAPDLLAVGAIYLVPAIRTASRRFPEISTQKNQILLNPKFGNYIYIKNIIKRNHFSVSF